VTLRDDEIRLLEALADDRLDDADRARADRLVRENADAAAWIALASAADNALRRGFPIPAAFKPAPAASIPIAAAPQRPAASRRALRFAMAAALLMAATGAYLSHFVFITSADSMYREFIAAGFEPAWKCKDDQEFIDYAAARTGEPFLIAQTPGVQILGWDSATDLITDKTVCLLAEREGTRVIVYIDRLVDDRTPRLRPFSGMHLHRGRLGPTVFYEVSPLDHAVILPLVYRPGEAPGHMIEEECADPPFTPRQYPSAIPEAK